MHQKRPTKETYSLNSLHDGLRHLYIWKETYVSETDWHIWKEIYNINSRKSCIKELYLLSIHILCTGGTPKETYVRQNRPTKETYKRDFQKKAPQKALPTIETNKTINTSRNLQKRPTKETYKRDLQKRPLKETYKRDLQKKYKPKSFTYNRDRWDW